MKPDGNVRASGFFLDLAFYLGGIHQGLSFFLLSTPFLWKKCLIELYGKNRALNKKLCIAEELMMGKSLATLASKLGIAIATAEVYGVDYVGAGRQICHEQIASYLAISNEPFQFIKGKILLIKDNRLCTIHNALNKEFSYNEIHFVLACLIDKLELFYCCYFLV